MLFCSNCLFTLMNTIDPIVGGVLPLVDPVCPEYPLSIGHALSDDCRPRELYRHGHR